MKPIIFLRVAWMKRYQGLKLNDIPKGGGKHIEEYGDGGEVFNYKSENGICYGYTYTWSIDINRLGANRGHKELRGVTVVWFTKHPIFGGQCIVGWYNNATVYRTKQSKKFLHKVKNYDTYNISAKAKDCILIPENERLFEIDNPRPGQNFVWYGHEKMSLKQTSEVWNYINYRKLPTEKKSSVTNSKSKRTGRFQIDVELRKKIEIQAINIAAKYYERMNFKIKSVESKNLGWDLEARKGSKKLNIEVKGSSGNYGDIELTPNEYAQFNLKRKNYVLFIVLNVLTKKPLIHTFFHYQNKWIDHQNNYLSIKKISSARVTIS